MMKKLLFFFILFPSLLAYSQGFQVNFQGQKQQGMGSAGAALAQDGASLFFNPGSAIFVKENSVNMAMTPVFGNTLFEEANTFESARTNSPMGTPFSAYALYKLKEDGKLSLGLAAYTPFGSTIQWEDAWEGRFALTRLELKSIFIQPTVSYKITDYLGIGAGFVYCTGKVNLQKDIPVMDAEGNYGHAELAGKAQGFGVNAGLYIEPSEKWSIGLTYKSQVNMAVTNGEATFTVPNSLEPNFPSGKFSSSLPLPQVLTLGAAWKASDKLTMALDINRVGWSAYDTLAFDYEQNTASLIDTKSARNYVNTYAFRLGAQYKIAEQFAARLGIAYGITPVPDGYVTPETPDANRINFTGGLGYILGNHFEFDASLLFTKFSRTDANSETNLSGTYTTIVVAPGLAIIYRF
jgi:long-chain fatty acid transport protein